MQLESCAGVDVHATPTQTPELLSGKITEVGACGTPTRAIF